MTATTVINAVRNRLGDEQKERWDDPTLLLYVSLCQNDICMFTHFYRKTAHLTLEGDIYIYELPTDCIAVNRFEYRDELLPVYTRNDIDKGNITYPLILKDNLPYHQVEFKIGENYEDLGAALSTVYGVTTSAELLEDLYGVVSTVEVGFVEDGAQPLNDVLLYYTAMPALLAMTEDETPTLPADDLLLPDIWFQAFLHFVSGMALQDDNDANNIQRGEQEGAKYLRIMKQIHKLSSKDFTSNIKTKLVTSYRNT